MCEFSSDTQGERTSRSPKSAFLPFAVRSEYHQPHKLNSTRNLNTEKTSTITKHSNTCLYNTYCNTPSCIPNILEPHDESFLRTTVGRNCIFSQKTINWTEKHLWHIYKSFSHCQLSYCNSIVFLCLLDASKLFCPFNHETLFQEVS